MPLIYLWYVNSLGIPEQEITRCGILVAILVVSAIVCLSIKYIDKLSDYAIIELSLLFAIIIPFLLPRMHERYFFIAGYLLAF